MSSRKLYIFLAIIFLSIEILAKEKSTSFTGIWQSGQDEKSFMLIKEFDVLELYDSDMYPYDYNDNISYKHLFFLKDYYIEKEVLFDSLMTQNIDESCGILFFYNKKYAWRYENKFVGSRRDIDRIDIMSSYEVYLGGSLVLTNVNMHTYGSISVLPRTALTMLYHKGQIDGRDYIRHFLELDVRAIASEKATIYDSTGTVTKMYLIKDDIISVKGQKNRFVQMEYETDKGRIIKGMVKTEDIAPKTDSRLIKVEQSTIYSTPGGEPTGQHFDKKRKIIITAYDGEWFKVKDIYNEDKSGWIKKSDTAFEVLF